MNGYQAGQKLLCGGYSAYTPTGKSFFVKLKRYGKTPHEGDVVYFYTSGLGRISHVGIVVTAQLKNGMYTIETIEGNTAAGVFERDGGAVALKKYEFLPGQVGAPNRIDGFGTPQFGADTCSKEQFIAMARSQIGYVEKASNRLLEEFRGNPGKNNYTKYNEWAVNAGWGYQPAQWCQTFASWCAYMACKSARDYQAGWIRQDDGKWTYRKADGQLAANEWVHDGGRWYVFDAAGAMITGWFRSAEGWYYLAEDGGMCTSQWICEPDGKSYYLTASGIMATKAYVRSDKPYGPGGYIYYWVDERGVWDPKWDTEKPHLEVYELAA